MDAIPSHLEFCAGVRHELHQQHNITTAWLWPNYSLLPNAYPTQFAQAVEAVRHVIEDHGRSPRDVIIAGDSAGGNLCLAILSHLSHPSNDVPTLTIEEPIRGMVLMSPWVSFSTAWPSMTSNYAKDIDEPQVIAAWAEQYLDGRASSPYAESILAEADWWKNAKVEQTLVVAGADEVFIDSITVWAEKFKVSCSFALWVERRLSRE